MCGIAGGFTGKREVGAALFAMSHRGPDAHGTVKLGKIVFGHVRLAIVDLDSRSNQPFTYRRGNFETTISFNGEIWNYKLLRKELEKAGHSFTTNGDTEVLAVALHEWGAFALRRVNGMFAVAWTNGSGAVMIARDRFGEIPLHYTESPFMFASEKKALLAMGASPVAIQDVSPGHLVSASSEGTAPRAQAYYDVPSAPVRMEMELAAKKLRKLLEAGAKDRAMTDVPACVLISGGIDSAAIALCLKPHVPGLVGYTASMNPKSRDLRCARVAAEALGMKLVEVKIPEPTAADLSEIVRVIEMPYKAQVEIGWPCLKLAEAMRSDGYKVTFSGEGSDELWASYGFAYYALKTEDWHSYRKELFLSQARKNFPRANKIFMQHGVECRLPFLHPSIPEFALSLTRDAVQLPGRPKAVMQEAFRGLLPDEIVDRPKMAFQDGVGMKDGAVRAVQFPQKFYRDEYARMYEKKRRSLWK